MSQECKWSNIITLEKKSEWLNYRIITELWTDIYLIVISRGCKACKQPLWDNHNSINVPIISQSYKHWQQTRPVQGWPVIIMVNVSWEVGSDVIVTSSPRCLTLSPRPWFTDLAGDPLNCDRQNQAWAWAIQSTGLHIQQAYTSLGTSCPNAYTKSFCWLLMHKFNLTEIRTKFVHHLGIIANYRQ